MKAWRKHPTTGKYRNHKGARAAGRTDRNAFFKSGSALLRHLIFRATNPTN